VGWGGPGGEIGGFGDLAENLGSLGGEVPMREPKGRRELMASSCYI